MSKFNVIRGAVACCIYFRVETMVDLKYLSRDRAALSQWLRVPLMDSCLMDITVQAKKDIEIEPASVMEAPEALRNGPT